MTDPAYGPELPFFVYGTLRPGERNHDLFLAGRTAAEEPARLAGAELYEGPGYPYAVESPDPSLGQVAGELVTAAPGECARLLAVLDRLEEYLAPGHPRNLYERVARDVVRPDGTARRAWVYLAAPPLAARLRAAGVLIAGGDWRTAPGR
ncbi:gamma-glutamylcyclotransferase family protein [Streptomyces sp. MUM 178J]|uniref:gamma-glutamylcyclotransferase family protein n=1 Tax=Streptomyces sp. MUM 178J TaxID=2791991 RepID=UPI001F04A9C1|nr:gamma-glutamylcyclotransferase family protein [Streptomyces sp. MUM 178J]WRQ79320.1 gamma-glutamylcyclotransferase family protein [Streptomyces sp. MUM 178J]